MNRVPLALLLTLLPGTTLAQAREPYTPSRGPALRVGLVGTYTEGVSSWGRLRGAGGHLELGASFPVGYEENELFVMARAGLGGGGTSLGVHGGLRSVFGREAWQTFTELGVVIHARPGVWGGPRLGLGVRHALSESFSLYGGVGGQLGFGSGLRLDVEILTGLRWAL
ncbi:MAG TPA: hypothetical protein VLQ93_17345 [Myxococcaceae bacterium]|nr:hypothetical protein [Myxococcaceae bacterium]